MRRFKTTVVLFLLALLLCAPVARAEAIRPLTAVKLWLAFWLKTGMEIDPFGIDIDPEIDPAGHKIGMEIDPFGNRPASEPPTQPAPTEGSESGGW